MYVSDLLVIFFSINPKHFANTISNSDNGSVFLYRVLIPFPLSAKITEVLNTFIFQLTEVVNEKQKLY